MMKKIFFIVTAIGALYLFYQAIGVNVFSPAPKDTVAQQQAQQQEKRLVKTAEQNTAQLAEFENMQARLDALEKENAALRAQVMQNEEDKAKLTQAQTIQPKQSAETKSAHDIDEMLALANKTVPSIELSSGSENANFTGGTSPSSDWSSVSKNNVEPLQNTAQSEQQKRLRQQAQLRDVAQRMQLAAIDVLNSSSR
jgi:hypothetical protein